MSLLCRLLEIRPLVQVIKRVEASKGGNYAYTCTICPEDVYLLDTAAMERHANQMHQGCRAKCELCGFMPKIKSGAHIMVTHRLTSHKIGTEGYPYYKCQDGDDSCEYYAASVREVVDHMLSSIHVSDSARYKIQQVPRVKHENAEAEAAAKKDANIYTVPRTQVVFVDNKKYRKCLICDELCITKVGRQAKGGTGQCLAEHAREKHDGKLYQCDICKKQFGDRLNVALHVKTQHGMEPEGFNLLECHIKPCKFVCKTKYDFGRHMVGHKKSQEASEMVDLEHVAFEKPILPHEVMDLSDDLPGGAKRLQCDICGMTMTNKDMELELEVHMEMEHSTTVKQCEHCGESFADEHSLQYHLRNKHLQNTKRHWRQYYDNYIKKSGGKKYVTTPDGKTMLAASWRKKNRPQVQCPMCKLVGDSDQLVYHFRMIHMGYKRYGCNLCQKRFPSSSNAKYHILRVHEGKGNMDGKLKTVIGLDYFDGKNLLMDFKDVEPAGWPDKKCVLEAIAKAREDNLATQVVVTVTG